MKHPGDYDYIYEGRGHNVGLAITKDGILPDSNQCILENKDYPDDLSCHVRDPKVWKNRTTRQYRTGPQHAKELQMARTISQVKQYRG